MPKALTEAQIAGYERDGFLFPVRVMSEEDTVGFHRLLAEAEAAGKLRGKGGQTKFYLRFPWVHALATNPALLDMVEDLIGPDIMLYHNTMWAKSGGGHAYVSWHQDNTYFGHDPCEVLTVWFAITPATTESGCMQFLPGTHRLGQLALKQPDINDANLLSSGQTVDFDSATVDPVPVELRPGEASIHHAFLIHGSLPNRSSEPRMGMTFIYHRPGLRQMGEARTSALLVRGEDRFNNFDHESPPVREDDPETVSRYRHAVSLYREKVRELGNRTIERFD
ncbi:MAG: phytanoyl-CoA dioxygenase family protein [Alphaproteobacteria bacterium]|nr:phytanoyl-CoA dioxygenase family protein [Alphaproteobacteria bacterium]